MLHVKQLTFNPFSVNTYIAWDETLQCAIIDPGCNDEHERRELVKIITDNQLKPAVLLNTHCHIDHFPGNKFVCDTYNLLPQFHSLEYEVMKSALLYQKLFGFSLQESPEPKIYLKEGDIVKFGNTTFQVIFTPGHSPGSLSFYDEADKVIFSGDVIFQGSVGRFDLPGASGPVLYRTITDKLMPLPDDVKVYSGHGPVTTIGLERRNNPFVRDEGLFR